MAVLECTRLEQRRLPAAQSSGGTARRLTLWKTKFILDATDYSRNFAQCFRLEEQRAVCEHAQAREERRAVERAATTERALT